MNFKSSSALFIASYCEINYIFFLTRDNIRNSEEFQLSEFYSYTFFYKLFHVPRKELCYTEYQYLLTGRIKKKLGSKNCVPV